MPKYRVVFYYHASATYDVETADEASAVQEARRLKDLQSEDEFHDQLILDSTDTVVEVDEEE